MSFNKNIKITITLIVIVLLQFVGSIVFAKDKDLIQINGFEIIINNDVGADDRNKIIEQLKLNIGDVNRIFDSTVLVKLKKCKIFITKNGLPNGATVYHQSAEWLKENGKDPAMAHGIEIGNIKNFIEWNNLNQPSILIHELAHFWMDVIIGNNDLEIEQNYNRIASTKKYDSVEYNLGGIKRAYALTNKYEYFAESSEAFFGRNDFYPFDRNDLKSYDLNTFELIKNKWTIPKK